MTTPPRRQAAPPPHRSPSPLSLRNISPHCGESPLTQGRLFAHDRMSGRQSRYAVVGYHIYEPSMLDRCHGGHAVIGYHNDRLIMLDRNLSSCRVFFLPHSHKLPASCPPRQRRPDLHGNGQQSCFARMTECRVQKAAHGTNSPRHGNRANGTN